MFSVSWNNFFHFMEYFTYFRRSIEPRLARLLTQFSVVVVAGPRQIGKTTLVSRPPFGVDREYLTLDDPALLEDARSAPTDFVSRAPRVTIDEVQRAPELLLAIKRQVARKRSAGRFLLTGSADLLALGSVADHLPGRAAYLDLEPLTRQERFARPDDSGLTALLTARDVNDARDVVSARPICPEPTDEAIVLGGFPEPAISGDATLRGPWFEGYVRTFIERGVTDIARVSDSLDLRRVLLECAARLGGLLNQSDVARAAGLPQTTVHRYLHILSAARLLDLVTPYARNASPSLVKAPRVYMRDVGLAAHLAGVRPGRPLREFREYGALLENLVLSNMRAWASTQTEPPAIHDWRLRNGLEVDFVVDFDDRVVPIEVKASSSVGLGDLRGLEAFLDAHSRRTPFGVVLHGGDRVEKLTSRVVGLPIRRVI